MANLIIRPSSVVLTANQSQKFSALDASNTALAAADVKWSIRPSSRSGKIGPDGVYESPRSIALQRNVVVVAERKPQSGSPASAEYGTAEVTLSSGSRYGNLLGLYLLALVIGLLAMLLFGWGKICECGDFEVLISPPVVTLTASQPQRFEANTRVEWSREMESPGLYVAPRDIAEDRKVIITGRSLGDRFATASAVVHLSPTHALSLLPASGTVVAGESFDLAAVVSPAPALGEPGAVVEWLEPQAGKIEPLEGPKTKFSTAGLTDIKRPLKVLVMARLRAPANGVAAAYVTVLPKGQVAADRGAGDDKLDEWLFVLIAVMGALGALIHALSSFTTYVGNREFRNSWIWWYFFKPFLGALVAVVVFLVYRGGFGPADLGLSTANCFGISALAVLVGLFAEQATIKLKDIFESIFTPRQDPRRDKSGGDRDSVQKPVIEGFDPPALKVKDTEVKVIGSGFAVGCEVRVGDKSVSAHRITSTRVDVTLDKSDVAKAGKLTLVVYNEPPRGTASNEATLEVKT